jgi:rSAM/selenodomain-associated transferase 2
VVLVDGGSSDDTCAKAAPLVDQLISSQTGRAAQMNEGAKAANGDILWFVHADTHLPEGSADAVWEALTLRDYCWGRFDVEIRGRNPLLKLVAALMNRRSRWTGIATGDQGIFIRRHGFFQVGGFPDIPLMEDVAISSRLRRLSRPCCLKIRLGTSGRRWERDGVLRTILLMWRLRLAFWLKVDPKRLAESYRECASPTVES